MSTNKSQKGCIKGKLLPFKLIRDCAHLMWSWIYDSFHGCPKGSVGYKANMNFVQSSTHICVEHVFVVLKERCTIIMTTIDMPLQHVNDLIAICIVLFICKTNNDKFDSNR